MSTAKKVLVGVLLVALVLVASSIDYQSQQQKMSYIEKNHPEWVQFYND